METRETMNILRMAKACGSGARPHTGELSGLDFYKLCDISGVKVDLSEGLLDHEVELIILIAGKKEGAYATVTKGREHKGVCVCIEVKGKGKNDA